MLSPAPAPSAQSQGSASTLCCMIQVGNVKIGSEHPIALQTMTTTDTRDVEKTVEQVKRCADAGADMVRITVQGRKEAEACMRIRERLFKDRCASGGWAERGGGTCGYAWKSNETVAVSYAGLLSLSLPEVHTAFCFRYDTPLVADIHFQPAIAAMVAEAFEKIRINPGGTPPQHCTCLFPCCISGALPRLIESSLHLQFTQLPPPPPNVHLRRQLRRRPKDV
jgi:hypothetical protein